MKMNRSSYDDVLTDNAQEARGRERLALNRGIDLLKGLQGGEAPLAQSSEALLYIRRLWTLFIEDLAHPDNGLPGKLRADLISIGIWIIKEADFIRQNKTGDLDSLIAINTVMRDALR
jgi:flagellar biosynthesis activator protein FlaF